MEPWLILLAMLLLTLERGSYVWIAQRPEAFRSLCAGRGIAWIGEPVTVVAVLFATFKVVQISVFLSWWYVHEGAHLAAPAALAVAGALVLVGQALNFGVFYRLGAVGVFFGDRLGHEVPWCRAFPFSWIAHPQYVGTVVTIWGLFLASRFPHPDWYVLPAVATLFYSVSAHLEARQLGSSGTPPSSGSRLDGRSPAGGMRARRPVETLADRA
jgi:phosphatidyl-N-methylethanolamine N-methyltransferase